MKLCARPLRAAVQEVIRHTRRELLIVSPFIKAEEARWVCEEVASSGHHRGVTFTVMTDLRADSILSGALDMEALITLGSFSSHSEVHALPRLHAKVYLADEARVLITSANLTPSGLDRNLEYGVAFDEEAVAKQVRGDFAAFARLGSRVAHKELNGLIPLADTLRQEAQRFEKSASRQLARKLAVLRKETDRKFVALQVGERTAQSVFSEAILFALRNGPLRTRELHPFVQKLLPDLCNDTDELVIGGERFGKRWKHAVRNAQSGLKRAGLIRLIGDRWILTDTPSSTANE